MKSEKVELLSTTIRNMSDEEKIRKINNAQRNGYITEEECKEILRRMGLVAETEREEKNEEETIPEETIKKFHQKAVESELAQIENKIQSVEPIRPGKKTNSQAEFEQNIDDFLDEVDKQVDEWEVFPKEQYTIEKLREEIKKLLILNARVGETTEPRYRKEGDRYTATDRLRITADIGNRIEEILRVLEGYKAEMESEKPITGIRRKMPERKKRIFRVFWI